MRVRSGVSIGNSRLFRVVRRTVSAVPGPKCGVEGAAGRDLAPERAGHGRREAGAAFALRGLTSGAPLGGLALAVFWKNGRGLPVISGMIISLACMTGIQLLPKLPWTKDLWMRLVGAEIFWPWYTLIGLLITLLTARLMRKLLPRVADYSLPSQQ